MNQRKLFCVSSDEEGGRDPFLPARKQGQGGGRATRVRGGKSKGKERQVNFGDGEQVQVEPSAKRPDERRGVEIGVGGVGGGREGSFSLLERRIESLEEGTTASLARIEQALLLIAASKK